MERDHEYNALAKIFSLSKNVVPFIEGPHKCVSRRISLKDNPDSSFQSRTAEMNSVEINGHGMSLSHTLHESCLTLAKYYEHNLSVRSFSTVTNLKSYHRIHTVGKPYECSECPRSFRYKSKLIIHQRTHTGS